MPAGGGAGGGGGGAETLDEQLDRLLEEFDAGLNVQAGVPGSVPLRPPPAAAAAGPARPQPAAGVPTTDVSRGRALGLGDLRSPDWRSGWRVDLEEAARRGDGAAVRRILAAYPAESALEYVEARGLLAKVAQNAGGGAGAIDVCRQLLALGASVDLSTAPRFREALLLSGNRTGSTPLCWAAKEGHRGQVEVLLAAGAAVDQKNDFGCSPLFMAALNGHGVVCDLLVAAGADPTTAANDGKTPIGVAEDKENMVIAEALREAADPAATPAPLTPDQQKAFDEGVRLKALGNEQLTTGDHRAAASSYSEAIEQLEHAEWGGAAVKGFRVALYSNRAEAMLGLTQGHQAVASVCAGNDADRALAIDRGHAKSFRRMQRADKIDTRVEHARALQSQGEAVGEAVEQQLQRHINESGRVDGLGSILERGVSAMEKAWRAMMPCSIQSALGMMVREAQLFLVAEELQAAVTLGRAVLAEATSTMAGDHWATPISHPDCPAEYNASFETHVLLALHKAQYVVARVLKQQGEQGAVAAGVLEEAKRLLVACIDGFTQLLISEGSSDLSGPSLAGDIFQMQTDLCELECQMKQWDAAADTSRLLVQKLGTVGRGPADLDPDWAQDMGIGSALHSAQALDHSIGSAGAEATQPAAWAMYEQMLELAWGPLAKAKVQRRMWAHHRAQDLVGQVDTSHVDDSELTALHQARTVTALKQAGRWNVKGKMTSSPPLTITALKQAGRSPPQPNPGCMPCEGSILKSSVECRAPREFSYQRFVLNKLLKNKLSIDIVNTMDNTLTKPKSMSKMNKNELYELCKKQQEEIITLQFHLNNLEMDTEQTFAMLNKKFNLAHEMLRSKFPSSQ
eukprot:SAG22_NODE_22_length_31438_cov_47.016529_2_plen_855_part_00